MRRFIFKRILTSGVLLLFAVLNSGCWGQKFFQMPQRSIDVSVAVDTVLTREENITKRLNTLQEQLEMQQEYSRRTAASTKMDMEGVKDQLNAIKQLLTESSMSGPSRRAELAPRQSGQLQGTRQQVGNENPDSIETSQEPGAIPAGSDSISAPGAEVRSLADSAGAQTTAKIPSAEVIFRQIYLDFSRMEYQVALDDSKLFLEKYSEDPLAQEVIFIRGECLIEQKKYFDALNEFSQILKKYPNGKKVPAALLRMAMAYDKIGDSDLAAGVIRRLVRDYPESEETAVAKEKFGEMLEN